MIVRELRIEDRDRLREIIESNGSEFTLPEFANTITDGVVLKDEIPVGYGMARLFCEALIVLDQNLSNFDKARCISALYQSCIETCKDAGMTEMNVFVEDLEYANLLIKHFGFRRYAGYALVKNLGETNGQE